jgi:hypothetical protein
VLVAEAVGRFLQLNEAIPFRQRRFPQIGGYADDGVDYADGEADAQGCADAGLQVEVDLGLRRLGR